ncbi:MULTISPECIES: hypothetical protein [Paenibacillus]|uniref:hypothetical protein n=1 Tax=Paenibacillus TaxID=44249 RepID=UPI0004B2FF00|nr:hypothetical protein [Paenibacillus odorifer]
MRVGLVVLCATKYDLKLRYSDLVALCTLKDEQYSTFGGILEKQLQKVQLKWK